MDEAQDTPTRHEVTRILDGAAGLTREQVLARLAPVVYDELRMLAAAQLRHERPDHSLQPTALVHEAYLRLVGGEHTPWEDRGHFFRAAARAMRRILIDHARRRGRQKRGGARVRRVPRRSRSLHLGRPRPVVGPRRGSSAP